MSQYRRLYCPGCCYFFTVVTYQRRPLLVANISRLREAFRYTKSKKPFIIDAIVVLPDHLHCLWQLPAGDLDFSGRWHQLKRYFSVGIDTPINDRQEKQVWQRRFWEHLIRDEEDWEKHLDYIHYNPVKHGYVSDPSEWPYSSWSRAVAKGWYQQRPWRNLEVLGLEIEMGEI